MKEEDVKRLQEYRERRREKKKAFIKKALIAMIPVAVVAAAVIFVLSRPFATPQKAVKAFYDAVYLDSDLQKMEQCVVEEKRSAMEYLLTLGGSNPNYITLYADAVKQYLGDDYVIEYDFYDENDMSAASLAAMKKLYSGVSTGKYLSCTVIFRAEKYAGAFKVDLDLVKQNGKWRLTRYDMLPIGAIPTAD